MDFNVVIQRLRVTHPLDCAQLLGHAGSAMRFGINRAMSTGYRNPNTGRASPMVLYWAREAISNGATAEEVIQSCWLQNEEDIGEMHKCEKKIFAEVSARLAQVE